MNQIGDFEGNLKSSKYLWKRWPKQYPTARVFDQKDPPTFNDATQGDAGTCYIMASMASLGEFPKRVKDVFLTQTYNEAGIYAVTL